MDTEMAWAQAIVGFLGDRGAATTLEHVAPIVFGHSWLDIQAILHREFPQLPPATAVEDAAALRPYYARISGDPAQLVIPGSVAFFRKVVKLAPCAIVSGSPHADVLAAAEVCGIARQLDLVLGAEDYGRGKPAPDGFLKAAEMLDKLLRGRKPPLRTIRVGGTHLFERESSAHIPPATTLVENAREYIREHACEGIGAIDVIRHVGTSRSLLELRFRQVCGKSILEDILDVRLAEVRRQLEKTNRSILQIGRDCGFKAPNYLKRLFRNRFGTSMRDYRRTGQTTSTSRPAKAKLPATRY